MGKENGRAWLGPRESHLGFALFHIHHYLILVELYLMLIEENNNETMDQIQLLKAALEMQEVIMKLLAHFKITDLEIA